MEANERTWSRSTTSRGDRTGRLSTCALKRTQTGYAWKDVACTRFPTSTSLSSAASQQVTRKQTTATCSTLARTTSSSWIARLARSQTSTSGNQRLVPMENSTASRQIHLTSTSSTWTCSSGTSLIESSSAGDNNRINSIYATSLTLIHLQNN